MDSNTYQNQLARVVEAFKEKPKTMLQVATETGILRGNICYFVRDLQKHHEIALIRKGKCPVSKHTAGFYTTDPDLIPKPGQSELFPSKTKSRAYTR